MVSIDGLDNRPKAGGLAKIGAAFAWVWVAIAVMMALGCLSEPNITAAALFLLSAVAAAPVAVVRNQWQASPFGKVPRSAVSGNLAGGVALGASADPAKIAQGQAERAAQASADAADEKRAAAASAAAKADEEKARQAEVTRAMKAFYGAVTSRLTPCDEATGGIAKAAKGITNGDASVYDGYAAARQTENRCRAAMLSLDDVEVPDTLPKDARVRGREAIQACQTAAVTKQMLGSTAQKIFDGDMRPSMLTEFEEGRNDADMRTMGCVASIAAVAAASKVELSVLTEGSAE
jgi:hypothetical protein